METENTQEGTNYKFTGIDGDRYCIHINRKTGSSSAGVARSEETTAYQCTNKGQTVVHTQVKSAYWVEVATAVLHCPEEILPESFKLIPFSAAAKR
jgi:hypothetical protein